jgi:hypothetical protein
MILQCLDRFPVTEPVEVWRFGLRIGQGGLAAAGPLVHETGSPTARSTRVTFAAASAGSP